jgi:hypothetical protein
MQRRIPEDWTKSILLPIYKGKGDPLECGSYRAIKLLEHSMKVLERVLEKRIREQVNIDEMQFGFSPGKGTTDAIFIVRQIQEKFRAKKKNLFYAFVDLEKAYDRVPREVVKWAMRKAGVEEWIVDTVMCMYEGAKTAVRTEEGESDWFDVRVGLHQGSALSPLLFIIVMDALSKEIKEGLPWELLYADDLVLMAESEEELADKLRRWRKAMERKGMKVNLQKTKFMGSGGDPLRESAAKYPCAVCGKGVGVNSIMCESCHKWTHKRCSGIRGSLSKVTHFECKRCAEGRKNQGAREEAGMELEQGTVLERVDKFCYLGDVIEADGGCDAAIAGRIAKGWGKYKMLAPLLGSSSVPRSVKGKLYSSCVRSCILYGSETWAVTLEGQRRLERTEMQMVRRMCGVTLKDRRASDNLRKSLGIECITTVRRRNRLRWFGHVQRKPDTAWVRKCMDMEVEGRRGRGRPKLTWMEVVRRDLERCGLHVEEAQNRNVWRRKISEVA